MDKHMVGGTVFHKHNFLFYLVDYWEGDPNKESI